jgi:hypothetical protein
MTLATTLTPSFGHASTGDDVSLWRLYLLRGGYLLIAVGMGSEIWPAIFHHKPWELMHGVADCMLAAMTALALLGVRYPLKMLPLLFFEMFWKGLWLIVVALPLWRANALDAATLDTAQACLMGIIFPLVIPWRYVLTTYVLPPGGRWR